jgi:hypothetical protein
MVSLAIVFSFLFAGCAHDHLRHQINNPNVHYKEDNKDKCYWARSNSVAKLLKKRVEKFQHAPEIGRPSQTSPVSWVFYERKLFAFSDSVSSVSRQ